MANLIQDVLFRGLILFFIEFCENRKVDDGSVGQLQQTDKGDGNKSYLDCWVGQLVEMHNSKNDVS